MLDKMQNFLINIKLKEFMHFLFDFISFFSIFQPSNRNFLILFNFIYSFLFNHISIFYETICEKFYFIVINQYQWTFYSTITPCKGTSHPNVGHFSDRIEFWLTHLLLEKLLWIIIDEIWLLGKESCVL